MLAEKAFSTDLVLPKTLQDKATILAGEPAWPASQALQVVDWLEVNSQEVVGVELWRNVQEKPLFVASSDYSPPAGAQITPESIAQCADKAREFVTKFSYQQDGLFNLTW